MARSRNIKPDFFLDDDLAEHHPLTRILFAGLWCLADREGRLKDKPKKIKAQLLPYDDIDANDALDALNKTGFIQRYEEENIQYIQVVNFNKHQNPHCKEAASTIPAPCKNSASTDNSVSSTADSLNLIPDSLNIDSLNPITASRKPRFAEWWDVYDKKVDRKKCEMKWGRLKWEKLGIEPDDLIADALNRHANCNKWPQYQSNPLTYLNGEKWNDELQKRNGNGDQSVSDEYAAARARSDAILSAFDDSFVGDNDETVPPSMDEEQRRTRLTAVPRLD